MPPVQRGLQMVWAPNSRSLDQPAVGTLQASVPSEDFIHEPLLVEARKPTQCWEIKDIPKVRLSSHIHRRNKLANRLKMPAARLACMESERFVLCCAVYSVVLCCVVPRCVVLCCDVLCCAVLCCVANMC